MDRSPGPEQSSSSAGGGRAPDSSDEASASNDSSDRVESVADMSASGTDDLSLDDDDEDRLLSHDPTPFHNSYPAPKWFSVRQLQAREIGCNAVSVQTH